MQIPDRLAVWPDERAYKGLLAPVPGGAGEMPVTIDARKRHRRDIAFDAKRKLSAKERRRRAYRRTSRLREASRKEWMEEGPG